MERTRSEWRETTLAEAGERKPQRQGSEALSTPRRAAAAQWPMEVSQLGVETGSAEAALGAEAGKAGRCWSCHRSCSRRAASLALGLAAAAADGMEKELHAGGITCTPCPAVDAAGGERRGEAYPAEGGCSTLTPQR